MPSGHVSPPPGWANTFVILISSNSNALKLALIFIPGFDCFGLISFKSTKSIPFPGYALRFSKEGQSGLSAVLLRLITGSFVVKVVPILQSSRFKTVFLLFMGSSIMGGK